jgi:hypothetical protein
MREVAGSSPGLDFYLLCEPIYVSLSLFVLLEVEHEFSELGQPQSQLFINQSHSDFSQE